MSVDYETYSNACKKAVSDDDAFDNFKNNIQITYMLEQNQNLDTCEYFCRSFENTLISKYGNILSTLPWKQYMENDMIGNPLIFKSDSLYNFVKPNTSSISFSHTTLRYILYSLYIFDFVKTKIPEDQKELSIVEVGSGYGGQCKIILDTFNHFGIKVKYTLIDLQDVNNLSKKYLTLLCPRGEFKCIPADKYKEKKEDSYDLFFSCFSLGEMDKIYQDDYIDNLVSNCKYWYVIWNNKFVNSKLRNFDCELLLPRFDRYVSILKFPGVECSLPLKPFESDLDIDVVQDYLKLINNNIEHFNNITQIIKDVNEPLEESIMTKHFDILPYFNLKQVDLYLLSRCAKNILNVGFNAGHSSLIMLLSNSKAVVHCFDIMEHSYSRKCFEYLSTHFGERIILIEGDSTDTLHKYKTSSKFNLVNINGGQDKRSLNLDFWNSKSLCESNAFLIWNNLDFYSGGQPLWEGYIRDNFINRIHFFSNQHYLGQLKN
jgi:hypothetical protein